MLLKTFPLYAGNGLFRISNHYSCKLELLGSFWPATRQVVKRGWLSGGPARFGSDLKTEEKLDLCQTGWRTAKAWPVDTSHMNPLAEAEQATLEAHGAVDVVFNFNPSITAGNVRSFTFILSLVACYKIVNDTYSL